MKFLNKFKDFIKSDKTILIEKLTAEINRLNQKLKFQQEVINNTNAYYKRKLYNIENRKIKLKKS